VPILQSYLSGLNSFSCSTGLSRSIKNVELSIFNIRRFYQDTKGEEISFHLLVDFFGKQIWDYDILFGNEVEEEEPTENIRIVDILDLEQLERQAVLQALKLSDYVQHRAAKMLGISQRVLNYKIAQLGITHPNWKVNI